MRTVVDPRAELKSLERHRELAAWRLNTAKYNFNSACRACEEAPDSQELAKLAIEAEDQLQTAVDEHCRICGALTSHKRASGL